MNLIIYKLPSFDEEIKEEYLLMEHYYFKIGNSIYFIILMV